MVRTTQTTQGAPPSRPGVFPAGQVALVLEYDGASYQGFQTQPDRPTVQGTLERALERLYGAPVKTRGASRTDAGVHAEEQVVTFQASKTHPMDVVRAALNFHLPEDIKVREAWETPADFDPRRHAVSRVYAYTVWNGPHPSPLLRRTAHYVSPSAGRLDERGMDRAAQALVGTHDLAAFTSPEFACRKATVRRVLEAGVRRDGHVVTFTVEANAFLPHQVRRTAGALMQVGLGRMKREEFETLVERADGPLAGPSLPAKGLTLKRIYYPQFPPSGDTRVEALAMASNVWR